MTISINTNGHIHLDGKDTGLGVTQRASGTVVFCREITPLQARSLGCESVAYRELSMPGVRYSLTHEMPASGNPGRAQFEADLRAVIKTA